MNEDVLISHDVVRHLAYLARLSVTDEEVAEYAVRLEAVVGYMARLKKVDVSDVPPTAHPACMTGVVRQDDVKQGTSRKAALREARHTDGKFYLVPKVFDS